MRAISVGVLLFILHVQVEPSMLFLYCLIWELCPTCKMIKDKVRRYPQICQKGVLILTVASIGPIFSALKFHKTEVLESLLKAGDRIDVNVRDKAGMTPLHHACKESFRFDSDYVIQRGAVH